MAIIGGIVGGTIAIYILSFLWEWLVFKRVLDDPVAGKLTSVGVALLMATLLAGYGMAPRGIFACGRASITSRARRSSPSSAIAAG